MTSGPFTRLSRPPRQTGNWDVDARELFKWFDRLWLILSGVPGIAWDIISKAGSKISDLEDHSHNLTSNRDSADAHPWDSITKTGSELQDIETRPHSQLQSVLQADVDLSDADAEKHITNALAFDWDRNRCYAVATAVDAAAEAGQHISVTCSIADITITLPSAALNTGMPIWIHKTDATAFKVITSVKNLLFQNSTMHLISNGTSWVIS